MQTIHALQERLMKKETRLAAEDQMSALETISDKKKQENPGKQRFETKKKVVECFYCKRKGHFVRNCGKKKRDEQGSSETSNCAFVLDSSSHGESAAVPRGDGQSRTSGRRVTDRESKSFSVIGKQILEADIKDVWLTNSEASRHITFRRDWLVDFKISNGETISLGDNATCEIRGTRTVLIEKYVDDMWRQTKIEHVLYVSKIRKNLFSVGICTTKSYEVYFKEHEVRILLDEQTVAQGVKQGKEIFRMLFRVRKAE
ncbi:hypothetical protein KM043_017094 [Ampulex compressa]|nr:hypothetical protein KM043_017094 [Ampulex compressa]